MIQQHGGEWGKDPKTRRPGFLPTCPGWMRKCVLLLHRLRCDRYHWLRQTSHFRANSRHLTNRVSCPCAILLPLQSWRSPASLFSRGRNATQIPEPTSRKWCWAHANLSFLTQEVCNSFRHSFRHSIRVGQMSKLYWILVKEWPSPPSKLCSAHERAPKLQALQYRSSAHQCPLISRSKYIIFTLLRLVVNKLDTSVQTAVPGISWL